MLSLLLTVAFAMDDIDATAPRESAPATAPAPQWTITVDPLTTALGYVHLQVERALSDRFSLYAGPHARLFSGILTDPPEPFVGGGAEVGLRWFPWGGAPRGGWVMVRSVGAYATTTEGPKLSGFAGYSSALVGGTTILADRFVLSGGVGYNQLYYTLGDYGSGGPFVALHTNLGVAF